MNASVNAQDKAYRHVKERILACALKPGEWVKAQDVATEVSVSRTPVREALSRLEQEGFVRRDGGWGYVVRSISLEDAREIYKVREALEAEAVREAAPRITAAQLIVLKGYVRKAEQGHARRRLAVFRANARAFHARIARIANNALLERLLSQLEDRIQLLGTMVFEKHDRRMDEVVVENRAILEALEARDAGRAEAAVRLHVQRAWESYVQYVARAPRGVER